MAGRNYVDGDLIVSGQFVATTMIVAAGAVADSQVQAAAAIQASKLQQQHAVHYSQTSGTSVVTETKVVHIVRGASGTVVDVDVFPVAVPSNGGGDDKQYTVDVKKSTAGGAFATILSSVVTISKTSTALTRVTATLSGTPTLIDGDALEVVITASGATGTQGQGLQVTITTRETPD